MRATVEVDEKMIREVQKKLGDFQKQTPSAISKAINRAVTNINSNVKKEVRKGYNIKAGDIGATLTKTRATKSALRAKVQSSGELIPLDRFKVSPKTVNPKRKSPIKIAVKKSSVSAVMGAFVADINGRKVFQRTGDSRLPIKRLFGPSVPQMIGNDEVHKEIEKQGQETLKKRLDHEINRILEKGKGK
ncbi:phage tail protein [Lentibacillus sp. Marseille-P4043]|uniref:phage tail protein n=1 Tax=Lentibacillus sp. Marseille-P4043 TaxID=2040293 RepID=UPI000D0B178E|nr:phage tail protein [Lentibacillus sp. Marseille-P4043]